MVLVTVHISEMAGKPVQDLSRESETFGIGDPESEHAIFAGGRNRLAELIEPSEAPITFRGVATGGVSWRAAAYEHAIRKCRNRVMAASRLSCNPR
jgi:hypothetical protein